MRPNLLFIELFPARPAPLVITGMVNELHFTLISLAAAADGGAQRSIKVSSQAGSLHFSSPRQAENTEREGGKMKIQTAALLLHLLLASAEPLDKFPHPYVAHPKPHQEVHLPEHHQGEHKLPRKCHTEYVSVVSKVG